MLIPACPAGMVQYRHCLMPFREFCRRRTSRQNCPDKAPGVSLQSAPEDGCYLNCPLPDKWSPMRSRTGTMTGTPCSSLILYRPAAARYCLLLPCPDAAPALVPGCRCTGPASFRDPGPKSYIYMYVYIRCKYYGRLLTKIPDHGLKVRTGAGV